ncbi:MAG: STAS domain-containing protein [Bryobacteraceae bacterium]
MSLEIAVRENEGIQILDLSGRLIAGDEAILLRDRVRDLAAAGHTRAVLNLKNVDYIDSTGLGAMTIGFTTMRRAGGGLKLLNLSRRNVELLVLTKLTTVFEVFNEEQEAVNSFFPDREVKHFDVLEFVQSFKKSQGS